MNKQIQTNKQETKQTNTKKKIPGSGTIEFQSSSSGVTLSAFSPCVGI
jgi:hypothetical protein